MREEIKEIIDEELAKISSSVTEEDQKILTEKQRQINRKKELIDQFKELEELDIHLPYNENMTIEELEELLNSVKV